MKRNKATLLTFAEKCKTILASNWQGSLNTIKADAKGSKGDIHTSKVKYMLKRGQPYIWVPENDLHNVNTIIDERGSFAVTSPFPGPLGALLKSLNKLPARIALSGDVLPLKEDKAKSIAEKLQEVILSEQKAMKEFTYTVSGVLSSSGSRSSRSDNLQELLRDNGRYSVYRFKMRSCTFVDGHGGNFEVDVEDLETSKADQLAPFSAKLIDGINQSEARRRALILFCFVYMDTNAKDAYVTSIDRKGFDVLAKVTSPVLKDGVGHYQWKELRFMFKEEAKDVEMFCHQLVEMEEEVINKVSTSSGLNLK
ncbi:heme oxygenase HugZ-like superfamily [Sesbania bispinosa]|nr:heme oxygenase HugZ-like superfamily [Sesbania bispinosa]